MKTMEQLLGEWYAKLITRLEQEKQNEKEEKSA